MDTQNKKTAQLRAISKAKYYLKKLHFMMMEDHPDHAVEILGAIGCLNSWADGIKKEYGK